MTKGKSICNVLKTIRKQVAGTMVVMGILGAMSTLTSCSSLDDELSSTPIPPHPVSAKKVKIFEQLEQMPSFPGGTAKLMEFINENLHYPKEAEDCCIQGKVVVSFMIERDGSITEAKVFKGLDSLLDAEAIRIVESMPKWRPGKFCGEPVRIKYFIPVYFRLKSSEE